MLAESFLLGSSTLGFEDFFNLGQAFKVGGTQDLAFQFRLTDTGAVLEGLVEYIMSEGVEGDYNQDGVVNAADYVVWRNLEGQATTLPNQSPAAATPNLVDAEDYAFWVANFGNSSGSGSNVAVPEPAAWLLALLGLGIFGRNQAVIFSSTRRI